MRDYMGNTPKKIKYNNDMLIGTKKKAIKLDAIQTKIDVCTSLLIIQIGIIAEAIVNIANVLIGKKAAKYKTIVVNATKIPPRAIFFAFIKPPLSALNENFLLCVSLTEYSCCVIKSTIIFYTANSAALT